MSRYPCIAGDPTPSHKERELWDRQRPLWKWTETIVPGEEADSECHRSLDESTLGFLARACQKLLLAEPREQDFVGKKPVQPEELDELVGSVCKGITATTNVRSDRNDARCAWNTTPLDLKERYEYLRPKLTDIFLWAARRDPSDEVCVKFACDYVEASEALQNLSVQFELDVPRKVRWKRWLEIYGTRDVQRTRDFEHDEVTGWHDASLTMNRQHLKAAIEYPLCVSQTLLDRIFEEPLSYGKRPRLAQSIDPLRPPFQSIRFAAEVLGIGDLADDTIAFVCPGTGSAIDVLAYHQQHTNILPVESDVVLASDSTRYSRVLVNVPTLRAWKFVDRFRVAQRPMEPWVQAELRRGYRSIPSPYEPEGEDIIAAIVRAGANRLLPGGQLVLLGGTEQGEYDVAADLLASQGLVAGLVGADDDDTTSSPILFKYQPGKWGEGQGPWAPYGCLWPSPRLASVWRKP